VAVYETAKKECPNPQAFYASLVKRWLSDPRFEEQRRTLGIIAWARAKHPDKVTPDFEFCDLPVDMGGKVASFYCDILEANEVKTSWP